MTEALPDAAARLAKSIEHAAGQLDGIDPSWREKRSALVEQLDQLAATLERVERTIVEIDGEEVTTITAELDSYDPDPAEIDPVDRDGKTHDGGEWEVAHGAETVLVQLRDPSPSAGGFAFQLTPLEAQRLADALRHQAFAVIIDRTGS